MAINSRWQLAGGALVLPVIILLAGCGSDSGLQPTQIVAATATAAPVPTSPAAVAAQPTAVSAEPTAVATLPAAGTPTPWVPPTALVGTPIPGAEATLTAAPELKRETLVFTNTLGENYNMTVEVADTPATQELGLMFRPTVPPDAGMLFDFGGDTNESFWMENTILPLSIGFIAGDGTIVDIRDMQPLDRNTTTSSAPYHYALETNQGYFAAHNIQKGDHVLIPGAQGFVLPGMPDCAMP